MCPRSTHLSLHLKVLLRRAPPLSLHQRPQLLEHSQPTLQRRRELGDGHQGAHQLLHEAKRGDILRRVKEGAGRVGAEGGGSVSDKHNTRVPGRKPAAPARPIAALRRRARSHATTRTTPHLRMRLQHAGAEQKLRRPHSRVKGVAILDAHGHIATLHRCRRDSGEGRDVRVALGMALHGLDEARCAVGSEGLKVLRRREPASSTVPHDCAAYDRHAAGATPPSTHALSHGQPRMYVWARANTVAPVRPAQIAAWSAWQRHPACACGSGRKAGEQLRHTPARITRMGDLTSRSARVTRSSWT